METLKFKTFLTKINSDDLIFSDKTEDDRVNTSLLLSNYIFLNV